MSWIVVVVGALAACGGGNPASPEDAGNPGGSDARLPDAGIPDAGIPDAGDTAPPPLTQGTSTVAGRAYPGYVDGARDVARFANPVNVACRDGALYVADFDNGKIRVIDTQTYQTTTLIDQQGFQRPFALAFGPDGTLYISTDNDPTGGHSLMSGTIWRVAPGSHTAVVIVASIGRPRGLVMLPGNSLAASDYAHHVIQLVAPATGAVTPLAGAWDQAGMVDATGADARFASPYGMALGSDGNLVVADFDNHRIRRVTPAGVVTTLAGTGTPAFGDGTLAAATFHRPLAVAVASNGDLYITDTENYRIRRITATAVQTVAGDGTAGFLDADDPLASQLYGLEGLSVVGDGSMLYIADGSRGTALPYNRIRQIARHW